MARSRAFLWGVVGFLSLAALMGIVAIVVPHRLEWEPIGSMLSVGLFSLTSLGSAFVLSKRQWPLAMRASFAVSGIGLVVCLINIWGSYPVQRAMDEAAAACIVWAIALPHGGLLSLTRFQGALSRVRGTALWIGYGTATLLSIGIVRDLHADLFWRMTACLGVLTGLGTLLLPILQRLYGLKGPVLTTPLQLQLTCPRCLQQQTLAAGESRCGRCRLRFHIDLEEPRCPGCGYLLYKLTTPRCPECGQALAAEEVETVAAAERTEP